MQRIIVTEIPFPENQITSIRTRYKASIFSLDGLINDESLPKCFINEPAIWRDAYFLARNWYLVEGKDLSEHEGISFGAIVEIDMWNYWVRLLAKIEQLKWLVEVISPKEIILATFSNDVQSILTDILCYRGKIVRIHPSILSLLAVWKDFDFCRNRLKEWELDRHARIIALEMAKRRTNSRSVRNGSSIEVLSVLEQPGEYLADSVIPVLSLFANSAVLLMDHRHQQKVERSSLCTIYFSDYVIKNMVLIKKYRSVFSKQWKILLERLSGAYLFNNKLWIVAKKKFYHLFRFKFPVIGVEINAAREIFRQNRVSSLLLTSDAHHGSRLLTMVANQLNIPSCVIQHGATVDEQGYIPLYATRFAAWGELSKIWLEEKGVSRERIVVTGSPRIDKLISVPTDIEGFKAEYNIPQDSLTILWAMDPILQLYNVDILSQLLSIVSITPWLHLLIRPHPSMNQLSWIHEMILSGPKKQIILLTAEKDLYQVLKASDSVIIQESTVGLEAMLFNKPVIVFLPNKRINHVNRIYPTETIFLAETANQLYQIVNELYINKMLRGTDTHSKEVEKFVQQYFYQLDGKSSQRVAEVLTELMLSYRTMKEVSNEQ